MPKSAAAIHALRMGTRGFTKPEHREECHVFWADGTYGFHRVHNDVYLNGTRVGYIDGDNVFDNSGERHFYIYNLWWYAPDGEGMCYQDEDMPEVAQGEPWPGPEPEPEPEPEMEPPAPPKPKTKPKRKSWLRRLMGN